MSLAEGVSVNIENHFSAISADYSTSPSTQVGLNSKHSHISSAVHRTEKYFAIKNPIIAYIKDQVLHEFMGNQNILIHGNTFTRCLADPSTASNKI